MALARANLFCGMVVAVIGFRWGVACSLDTEGGRQGQIEHKTTGDAAKDSSLGGKWEKKDSGGSQGGSGSTEGEDASAEQSSSAGGGGGMLDASEEGGEESAVSPLQKCLEFGTWKGNLTTGACQICAETNCGGALSATKAACPDEVWVPPCQYGCSNLACFCECVVALPSGCGAAFSGLYDCLVPACFDDCNSG